MHSDACDTAIRPCLQCKLRAWRDGSSSLGVHVPEGWGGPSLQAREQRIHEQAAELGTPIDRAPS